MKLLVQWKVISTIATKWMILADLLEFDTSITDNINEKYKGDPELACREVFSRWLKREAKSTPSWECLLDALENGLDLQVLADDLRSKLDA